MSKTTANLMPALYSHRIHDIQVICRAAGYALAVHGSMQRDLDLVAFPWAKRAIKPSTLVNRICAEFGLRIAEHCPSKKPHGRIAYSLMWKGAGFMDLSIMPRVEK